MACRLFNRSSQLLRVDLRGGATLQLRPGETSAPLREELLYDNMFVTEWERSGLLVRLPIKFAEVQAHEAGAARQRPAGAKKGKKPDKSRVTRSPGN